MDEETGEATTKKLCLECKTHFIPKDRKGRNYCPPCKFKWCSERGYSYRRFNYKYSEREKLCLDCNNSFIPIGRKGKNYCPSCKLQWCSDRGYKYRRFNYEYMGQIRQSEFFGCVSSKSYDPSATLNKEQQSESHRCDSGESSNPKAMPIKEHQSQFRGHGLCQSLNNNNHLSKIVNLNLIQQVKALTFTNKAVLFQYLESQEYILGTKKINFGKYSEKKLRDFNDPSYYKLFIENDIKLNEGKQLNDEKLAFYFYVSYINKKI